MSSRLENHSTESGFVCLCPQQPERDLQNIAQLFDQSCGGLDDYHAGEFVPPGRLFFLHWDAATTNFAVRVATSSMGELEHVTFAPDPESAAPLSVRVGDRVRVWPAHVDPTVAYHEALHVVDGEDVLETWAIDLRGW